jgi:hypothetical protein
MPGSENGTYSFGSILEFGDGTKDNGVKLVNLTYKSGGFHGYAGDAGKGRGGAIMPL